MPTRRPGVRWSAEAITAALVSWHREHGRPPTAKEWIRAGEFYPSNQTVRRVFGDWDLALQAAAEVDEELRDVLARQQREAMSNAAKRVPTRRPGLRWTPDLISYAIRIWYRRNGRLPSPQDWRRAGEDHPSESTVIRIFGAWTTAVAYATAVVAEGGPEQLVAA